MRCCGVKSCPLCGEKMEGNQCSDKECGYVESFQDIQNWTEVEKIGERKKS